MPCISYVHKQFEAGSLAVIDHANVIIAEYAGQGYDLTLRQLYYQFVARDLLENNDKNYKRLGSILSDARRAGLVDWNAIVDRTRFIRSPAKWDSPSQIVAACAQQFDVDWWACQPVRVEVWVEKDALIGVLQTACQPWHCPYFSCRGYVSDSEIWASAQRMLRTSHSEMQRTVVLHLGDHDPSGIDMTRDIQERLWMFSGCSRREIEVRRVALTMSQIEEKKPPPNPAKTTDSRYAEYRDKYGDESWELDALDPTYIENLIANEMQSLIKKPAWKRAEQTRDAGRSKLVKVSDSILVDELAE